MRKRIKERISETINAVAAAQAGRISKPHRQERKARRILREQQERELRCTELSERAALRERLSDFNDACRTTAGKKRQGKGREIVETSLGRIAYERQQRCGCSLGEYYKTQAYKRELDRKAEMLANNFNLKTN